MAKGKQPNMKVNVTADNGDLSRKMKDSKAAVKDFEKVSGGALDGFSSALGVNVGKVEQLISAVRGLGEKMQQSSNEGTKALGALLKSIDGISAGIAGIGIGALVAGFKLLNDEAQNFKSTIEGANIEMATAAYIDTYRQVVHDFNKETGQGMAEAESNWKKFWSTLGANWKAYITSGAFAAAEIPVGGTDQLDAYGNVVSDARNAAKEAEELTTKILEKTDEISVMSVQWARWEREIAEYKRIAYDKTVDTATQQAALAKASELIKQRYQEEAEARAQIADWQAQINALASSGRQDIQKESELRIAAENVVARMNNAMRELSKRQATVALQAEKEAEAREQALAAAQALAASKASLADWRANAEISAENNLADMLPKGAEATTEVGLAIPVTPVLDTSTLVDITNELQSVMTSAFDTIGMSIGELIGDLATGGDAWGNFANTAIGAFGDMAISIGKMAISTGVATLGIKAALKSLNGYVAIAAGTALVALGAAVKTGLSNIASGSYSSSANVATAGGYGSTNMLGADFETREMKVEVTGTIRASGNELLTVIENENTRKKHTT